MGTETLEARIGANITEFERQLNRLSQIADKNVKKTSSVFSELKGAIAGIGLGFLIKDIAQTSMKLDGIRNTLKAVTGTAQGAGQEFDFVRSEAKRLGLELISAGQGYAKFSASAKTSGLAATDIKKIFSAVSETATVLGFSAEETSGSLLALSQMMNKGKITAEDYTGQFGERIPGALGLLAKAAGKSTTELTKMFEKGELGIDLLPKLADEMRKTFSPGLEDAIHGSRAAFNRFNNALTEAKGIIAGGGFMEALATGAEKLAAALGKPETIKGLEILARFIGKTIEIVVQIPGSVVKLGEIIGKLSQASPPQTTLTGLIPTGMMTLPGGAPAARGAFPALPPGMKFLKHLEPTFPGEKGFIGPLLPNAEQVKAARGVKKELDQKAIDKQVKIEQELANIHQRFLEARGMGDEAALADIERRFAQEEAALKKLSKNEAALSELRFIKEKEKQAIGRVTVEESAKQAEEMMRQFNEAGEAELSAETARRENLLEFYKETGMERLADELKLEEDRDRKLGELQERFIMGSIDSWKDFEREKSEITTTFTKRIQRVQENAIDTTDRQMEDSRSVWRKALDWLSDKVPETGKKLTDSAVSALSSIKQAASDLLFDFFTGQLKSLEDVFKRTFHFILRIVTDVIAEIVVKVVLGTKTIKELIEKLSKAIDDIFSKDKVPPIKKLFESLTSSIMKTTLAVVGLSAAMNLLGGGGGGGGFGNIIGSILGGGGGSGGGGIFGGGGGGGGFGNIGSIFSAAGKGLNLAGLGSIATPFAGAGLGFMGGSQIAKLFGAGQQGQNIAGGIGAGGIGIGLALAAMGLGPLGVGIGALLGGAGGGILGGLFGGGDPRTSAQRRTDRVGQYERLALDASEKGDMNEGLRWLRDSMQISQASPVIMPALQAAGNAPWFYELLTMLNDSVNSPQLRGAGVIWKEQWDQLKSLNARGMGFDFDKAGGAASFARGPAEILSRIMENAATSGQIPADPPPYPWWQMQHGGITTGKKPVFAMLSEKPGLREAVIPLNPQTIRMLQREGIGGGGAMINLSMPITIQSLDPEAARRVDWRSITREEILPQVRDALAISGGRM